MTRFRILTKNARVQIAETDYDAGKAGTVITDEVSIRETVWVGVMFDDETTPEFVDAEVLELERDDD